MRADAQTYTLATATPVTIRGGAYALVGLAAGGNLQFRAPDGTFVAVTVSDAPATPISVIGGTISPIWLPAGQVQLPTGSGWLVGIG